MSGSARWDLEANKINQYIIGAGYVDDCFVLAANYVTAYSYSAGTTPPVLSHAFMLQIGLRTIASSAATGGAQGIAVLEDHAALPASARFADSARTG